MATIIDRTEPTVVPAPAPRRSSRVPRVLRVPMIVVLNLGINALLWEGASMFLTPELGAVSKVPTEGDLWTGPVARLAMKIVTIWSTWAVGYDFYDVAALTVLTHAPYAYLLITYFNISPATVAALVNIEVLSMAIPTYLLRKRDITHNSSLPLRNRFLIDSMMVQLSNTALAAGVYVVVIWSALSTGLLNRFLVTTFDIPTLQGAYAETPFSLVAKILFAAVAAKTFLLNPSFAAQPASGVETPLETPFDASTATLPATLRHNFWFYSRRTRTLIKQTWLLNAFVVANTTQRCLTLAGTEFNGAVGYAGLWVIANVIIAAWFAWTGDTSLSYSLN
jgi:hypothetical protein